MRKSFFLENGGLSSAAVTYLSSCFGTSLAEQVCTRIVVILLSPFQSGFTIAVDKVDIDAWHVHEQTEANNITFHCSPDDGRVTGTVRLVNLNSRCRQQEAYTFLVFVEAAVGERCPSISAGGIYIRTGCDEKTQALVVLIIRGFADCLIVVARVDTSLSELLLRTSVTARGSRGVA